MSERYLLSRRDFSLGYVMTATSIEDGVAYLGRSELLAVPEQDTQIEVFNMLPWTDDDWIYVVGAIPSQVLAAQVWFADFPLRVGTTSASGVAPVVTVDLQKDEVALVQMRKAHLGDALTCLRAVRGASVGTTNGSSNALPLLRAALFDLPQRAVEVVVNVDAYARAGARMAPTAEIRGGNLFAHAVLFPLEVGEYLDPPALAICEIAGTGLISQVLSYGLPFSQTWSERVNVGFGYAVPIAGSTGDLSLTCGTSVAVEEAHLLSGPIVGPVGRIDLNGRDASLPLIVSDEDLVLRWEAPRERSPTSYRIYVSDLGPGPSSLHWQLRTPLPEAWLPNVLRPGRDYAFIIRAEVRETGPFGPRIGWAEKATAIVRRP